MLNELAGFVVPVLSIGLTYVLGRLQAVQSDKKAAYKEAYNSFYLPFIRSLYETQIWDIGFSRLDHADQFKLFQLITKNIQYMDKPIIEYVDILYGHFGAILLAEHSSQSRIITPERLDEVFDELTDRVLSRSKTLSGKLHLPLLGEFVQELYRDTREERERQRAGEK